MEPRGEQKLLAAIIGQALKDAAVPMSKKPSENQIDLLPRDTSTALGFLFNKGSMIEVYLDLLDINVEEFRRNLLNHMYQPKKMGELTEENMRNMRINYLTLQKIKNDYLSKA